MSKIAAGRPFPLGATYEGDGVNFALFSAHAEQVDLCLFDPSGGTEIARLALCARTGDVWHGFVPGLRSGQLYGWRVHGRYSPETGHRFNPNKLLIDPYARELSGRIVHHDANFGYIWGDPLEDLSFDTRDNAVYMPKCVVVGSEADYDTGRPPLTPWRDTIVYELHVAGMTRLHPDVPAPWRGTFAGLASDAVIGHLRSLGITAVELLPIFPFVDEPHLVARGLTNYWGYNPYAFLASDPRYANGSARAEIRALVRRLHDAGIEVILDVVYNHTGEGWHLGPTLSLRGIDNASYYRLRPDAQRYYVDDTGCGNTLALDREPGQSLAIASLRHWVEEIGADGFRFDLATTLARGSGGFDADAPLLRAIGSDPVLSCVKLIAEPWDVGPGGYRLGAFPPMFAEWNDRYRDAVRSFWRGDDGRLGELATRLTGSADAFGGKARGPLASLNFVTAHDGFTLRDLVSYATKHNEANREANRDGTDDNLSSNHGAEGETDDAAIRATRLRQMRNLMTTLLVSQGVPMLLAGDEIGHTQNGNNNAYCQDNPTTWIDWTRCGGDEQRAMLAFTRHAIRLRQRHAALRQTMFLTGAPREGDGVEDASWWSPEGRAMTRSDWHTGHARALGLHLAAVADGNSAQTVASHVLLLLNAHDGDVTFRLPPAAYGPSWHIALDTAREENDTASDVVVAAGETFALAPRSLVLLECPRATSGPQRATRAHGIDTSTLDLLSARAGIEPSYWDLKGRRQITSPGTKTALLSAMGFDTSSRHNARETLRTLKLAPWRRLLAPVTVLRRADEATPLRIALSVPAAASGAALRWQVSLEQGDILSGESRARDLHASGSRHVDGGTHLRLWLDLPGDLPFGYHRLAVDLAGLTDSATLVVAPQHAYRPDWLARGGRNWGLACQLYGLSSSNGPGRNCGIGDLTSLGELGELVTRAGGAALGISPLHALFVSEPGRASPYSPSSRLFFNPLYIDVTAVPEFATCAKAHDLLAGVGRDGTAIGMSRDLVDYERVAKAKLGVLDALHAEFERGCAAAPGNARQEAFDSFLAIRGKPLERLATFQALEEQLGPPSKWSDAFRDPGSRAVSAFADARRHRIRFFAYLQFEADRQLAHAASAARDGGMAIGLYGDLAVGAAPDGAEVWSAPTDFARGCRFGAPPDPFSASGQDWGMPPVNPHRLMATAYRPFADLLAANMRHTGALRLDHVMWLERMFWIPPGGTARDGAYVRYPREDLLGVLALESHRNRCLIVGEDLGTVPDGFRECMEREAILSYRFVRFERFADGLFRRPETYPRLALATPASHDLATFSGFWLGRDIDAMMAAGLVSAAEGAAAHTARGTERRQLVDALADQNLLPPHFPDAATIDAAAMDALIDAVHGFLARTPSALVMINIEDLMRVTDQANLPGTVDSYPNWRRRLPLPVSAASLAERLRATAAILAGFGR